MLAGRWIIDGYDLFEAYKIVVTEADGLDVAPKVKKREEHDWPDESGVEVDTATTLVYDPLDIKLQCYVIENTFADAVKRINGLTVLIASSGVHLLGSALRKRLYPVLLQEISDYKRVTKANADKVVLEFSVKLLCHMPENRMGVADVVADEEVTLVIPTGKDYTVWWGDGSKGEKALTHVYDKTGIYTVLISGTGVTSALITGTGVIIDEYSYPASGDIIHVDVSPTSGEAYAKALEAIAAAIGEAPQDGKTYGRKNAAWVEAAGGGGLASQVIIDTPFTPANTPVAAGDNGQVALERLQGQVTANKTQTLANIIVNAETAAVVISGMNIVEGEVLQLIISNSSWAIAPATSGYAYMRINGITSNNYTTRGTGGLNAGTYFRWLPQMDHYAIMTISIIGEKVHFSMIYSFITSTGTLVAYPSFGILVENITAIESISLTTSGICSYKAGDVIKLIKL